MKSFKDKICVITGAASGIGLALATELNHRNARLILIDQNEEALNRATKDLKNVVHLRALDIRDKAGIESLAEYVQSKHGGASLMINNAGVALAENVNEMTDEDFHWVMDINFWGMVNGSRAFLPQLQAQPDAALVNVSSLFGLIAVPTQSAYNASKFAIRGFTEALRQEVRSANVTVHSVHPGGVKTNIARNARFHRGLDGKNDHGRFIELFEKIAMTTPEKAANIILKGVSRRKPRILVGPDAVLLDLIQRITPTHYTRIVETLTKWA
tara:strand:+ start:54149 stop:54958 length:810 start_codon:yes stop_codon:yes gene_type:complete